MSELGHEAQALLAEARQGQGDDPSVEDRARMRAKVAAALALSTLGGTAASAALPKTAAAQLASAGLSTKLVLASLVIATAGAAAVTLRGAGERQASAPRSAVGAPSEQPSEPPSEQPSLTHSASTAKGSGPVSAPDLDALDPESTARRPTRSTPRAVEPTRPPSLHAELALIAAAQQALRDARPTLALEHTSEHATRFPKGALIQERLGIDAIAACTLGERARGLSALKKLARRAPNAPLLARARAACRAPDSE